MRRLAVEALRGSSALAYIEQTDQKTTYILYAHFKIKHGGSWQGVVKGEYKWHTNSTGFFVLTLFSKPFIMNSFRPNFNPKTPELAVHRS